MSSAFPQNFGYNLAVIGQFPQGEFKDEGVGTGLGLDFNIAWYPLDKIALGINFGGSQYGFSQREIPFNQWTNVGLIEETKNNMAYGNLLLKIIPFKGPVRIFGEGLIGIKNLNTMIK